MSVYVTDTHPLVWFMGGKHGNLSKNALEVFVAAEAGQAFIYIPAVVLWEAAILDYEGKIKLFNGFSCWAEMILKNSGFGIAPLEPVLINLAVGYKFHNDPFDKVIVATAADLSLPLITKDAAITNANVVDIYW